MTHFRVLNSASSDLVGISRYTLDQWGSDQRDFYLENIDRAFYKIADNSKLGLKCDYIIESMYKLLEGKYMVMYRVADDGVVEIVRVLHQSMDVSRSVEYC